MPWPGAIIKSIMVIKQLKRPQSRRGCLWIAGRILLVFVISLAVLLPLGAAYQNTASARDLQRFLPPGQLIDVGGFRLHLYCIGEGSPTVVLEAGMGDGGYVWNPVQKSVSAFTRVCSYDRPGLGWSDFVDRPFLRDAVAQNLHTLLKNAGIPGPYLLVGHSVGGIYVRAFAHLFPGEVDGMVLVDSSHENQAPRFEARYQAGSQQIDTLLHLCKTIAPFGILRLFDLPAISLQDSPLPQSIKVAATAMMNRVTYCTAIDNEMAATDIDLSQPSAPASLGNLPLIVLTSGASFSSATDEDAQGRLSPKAAAWLELQRELANLSTHSLQIIAYKSSHYIQWDQPGLVVQAIRNMVDNLRS
jgi:pimeloyl-ACP methyl ester carboxylesterase